MLKVGDTFKLRKTGKRAKIIGIGSMALPRTDNTVYNVQPEEGGPSVNVLPEEIELL
jgi:hypothetical protein